MHEAPRPRRKLKPPPNLRSRSVQLRLFVLVAACLGVFYLIGEAAKPERWRWLTGQVEEAPPEEPLDETVDTRLHRPLEESPDALAPGTVRITDPLRASTRSQAAADTPVEQATSDAWANFYGALSGEQRMLLAKAFWKWRQAKRLDPEDAGKWQDLLAHGDRAWLDYRTGAARQLAAQSDELSEAELSAWQQVLDDLANVWEEERAALASLADEEQAEEKPDDEILQRIQDRWEGLTFAAIRDDTVHRPAEGDAWFRLMDILHTTPARQLARQAAEDVTFMQLFKQPDDYRGKLVRIKGRIRQAKESRTAKNVYGIDKQYILWIQPEGGAKSPIVVYSLEMPPGFPSLSEPDLAGGYTGLREDVEVTGYFFKRWAYPAHDGLNTAPLMLAKAPRWFPSPDLGARSGPLPSAGMLLSWIAAAALFGTVVAVLAYWRSKVDSPALESFHTSPQARQELEESLTHAQAGPSVQEMLRELEARDRQDEGRSS